MQLRVAAPAAADRHQRALAELRGGRLDQASALYHEILRTDPQDPDALQQLGVIAVQTGDAQGGIELIERSLRVRPDQAEAYSSLGNALRVLKRPEAALESYERALTLDPQHAAALNNRGSAFFDLERFEEALASYERALQLRPSHTGALYNHGNTLFRLGRLAEALHSYEQAIRLRPDFEAALRAHSRTLFGMRRHLEALPSLERYLLLYPNNAEALNELGLVLSDLQRVPEAIQTFDRAIRADPTFAPAHYHRAVTLSVQGWYAEAIKSYDRLLSLQPDSPWAFGGRAHLKMMQCDWAEWQPQIERLQKDIAADKLVISPMALCSLTDSAALQQQCARGFAAACWPPQPQPLWSGERYTHERIRVAYVSADFRMHPVAYLLGGVLERHDRRRFEITALSLRPPEDSVTGARVRQAVDTFIDVSLKSDEDVANLIRELQIDVLVDLQGYTLWNRTGILAHRAAPLQVNYLGFPATMGAPYMDYILADEEVIPAGAEGAYTEQVVRLPHCYLPFDDSQIISENVPTRTAVGLPAQGLVLCAFNNHYKINPEVYDVWMNLLRDIPGSILWLRGAGPEQTDNLQREAAARGVAPGRLVFAEQIVSLADHLARLRLADLFLDTVPYNAHATAAHALWAGVPVLTCRGGSFASRVGASLLRATGLQELIADDLGQYLALAKRLSASPDMLAELRARLARNRSGCPLFHTANYCRALETAYVAMWERLQSGAPPHGFAVAPN
jgi:predicted O-linked N-acetylglucosamine transferase (SPINDLY family)